MSIKKIKVTNFKSFKDLEIILDKFNVLIGANASGKSNFVQICQTIRLQSLRQVKDERMEAGNL